MDIELTPNGDLTEVSVSGVFDHEAAGHFRDVIDEQVRDGCHRFLVDFSNVSYLSSAGLTVLTASEEQMTALKGLFGIWNPSPLVRTLLEQTKNLEKLTCDPAKARAGATSGSITLQSDARIGCEQGLFLEIYALPGRTRPLTCQVIGQCDQIGDERARQIHSFDSDTFGLGIGCLGDAAENTVSGEVLCVAGATAQSPRVNGGRPDYSISKGDFIPSVNFQYGVRLEGDLPTLIRFSPAETGDQATLSQLARMCLKETDSQTVGVVLLAECAGLIGAQMRQPPASSFSKRNRDFTFPDLREWLSFSAEQIHQKSLVLITGLAAKSSLSGRSSLHPFLRHLDETGDVLGHFHAAVFPYRPLKKRTLNLHESVASLFNTGDLKDVVHLLWDERSSVGPGQSELTSGACWVAPIRNVTQVEESK